MRFFTSDTHFGHTNIIDFCDRPFINVDDMNTCIIESWNSTVGPDDTVYHLGDVALGDKSTWPDIFSKLNGTIHLVIGNHDAPFAGNKPKYRDKYMHRYTPYFATMFHYSWVTVAGRRVNLSHFPYDGDSHDNDRYNNFRYPDEGIPLIHGHTHQPTIFSRSAKNTPQLHVGMDAWDFIPVSEEWVEDWLDSV